MKGERREIFNSASVGPDKCAFCKIAKGEFPSYKVFEDEAYIAFLDINPFSRGHTLVCPKAHGETIWDMKEHEIGGLFLARLEGLEGRSWRPRARKGSGSCRTTERRRTRSSPTSTST